MPFITIASAIMKGSASQIFSTPSVVPRSTTKACGSITSIDALSCGHTGHTIAFGIMMSLVFVFFLGLCFRLSRESKEKKRANNYDIEAPPPNPADRTAHVTKDGTITWDDGSIGNAWARMNEHMKEMEQQGPSRWERRTFPGGRVVIDARSLPGNNHRCAIKKLSTELDPRLSESSTDSVETEHAYFVGQEPGMRAREMV